MERLFIDHSNSSKQLLYIYHIGLTPGLAVGGGCKTSIPSPVPLVCLQLISALKIDKMSMERLFIDHSNSSKQLAGSAVVVRRRPSCPTASPASTPHQSRRFPRAGDFVLNQSGDYPLGQSGPPSLASFNSERPAPYGISGSPSCGPSGLPSPMGGAGYRPVEGAAVGLAAGMLGGVQCESEAGAWADVQRLSSLDDSSYVARAGGNFLIRVKCVCVCAC